MRTSGLYAILDLEAFRAKGVELARVAGPDAPSALLDVARALLASRPTALQLRAKREEARVTLALLRALAPLARAADVPLVANDRVDLAALAGADLVHLGQDDLPLADARRVATGVGAALRFGRSTHDAAQLAAELADRPDYVAFGPVFGTSSKADASATVGLERLARAVEAARAAAVPLVAIGGVSRANAASVVAAGARWAASISDLVAVDARGGPDLGEIERRARALDAALRGGP